MKPKIPIAIIVAWYAALAAFFVAAMFDDAPLSYRIAWCGLALSVHAFISLVVFTLWRAGHGEF